MKTKLWILSCIFFLTYCSSDEKPEQILSKEQMVALMIDLNIAQTRVDQLKLKKDSAAEVYDQYHAYLLNKHLIKDSTFYESLRYYLNRPNDLDVIHEGILDTLSFRLQKIEAQEEKDKKDKEALDTESNGDDHDSEDITPIPTKIS